MIKAALITIALCLFTVGAATVWADRSQTLLVLDMQNADKLPTHFRTSNMTRPGSINWQGYRDLHIAGSAQFSKLGLKKILQTLGTKQVIVIDLRQESHGFLNGNAISWYAPQNAGNASLSNQAVEREQEKLLAGLERLQRDADNEDEVPKRGRQDTDKPVGKGVTVYKILSKASNGRIDKTKSLEFAVRNVSSEEELVRGERLAYHRLYMQDFHAPSTKEVDRFINLVKAKPRDQWFYFHCRAGIGRTTVFMMMVDMMHNAKEVSFDDMLARQVAIGGKDLSQLPPANDFKYPFAKERMAFVKQFYQYAQENQDHFQTSWSMWLRKHQQ